MPRGSRPVTTRRLSDMGYVRKDLGRRIQLLNLKLMMLRAVAQKLFGADQTFFLMDRSDVVR
jgi:hypothetical protein